MRYIKLIYEYIKLLYKVILIRPSDIYFMADDYNMNCLKIRSKKYNNVRIYKKEILKKIIRYKCSNFLKYYGLSLNIDIVLDIDISKGIIIFKDGHIVNNAMPNDDFRMIYNKWQCKVRNEKLVELLKNV